MPILDPRLTAASDKIEVLEAQLVAKDKEIERLQAELRESNETKAALDRWARGTVTGLPASNSDV